MSTSLMQNDKPLDYTSFHEKGKGPKKLGPQNGFRWWLVENKDLPSAVMTHVSSIIRADQGRISGYNTYAKLYGTWTPTFWNGYQLANTGKPTAPMRERLTYNIVQSCVDTLTSRISQNKPKPMFLTSAGDSKLQRKAKKLDAFEYGIFYENRFYDNAPFIFRDSAVFGEGILHSYAEFGRVKHERVLPYELLVDYLEAHSGPSYAKTLFRIKNIDRTVLLESFPDYADQIKIMANTSMYISTANRSVSDTVTVVEAWRLPTGDKPGRHVIVSDQCALLDEDYEDNFFPFAVMRYSPRLYGFYAQGMAEQLIPTQVEINRTLISIQRSLYLGGTHKIFVKSGSKVIKSHFDNLIGTILEYAGDTPPQYVVPQLVQPEIYAHLDNMINKGHDLVGVSQMSAANEKPMGLDSGKALRVYDDNQVQRFQTVAHGYEQFAVDVARNDIAVARKIYKEEGNFTVKVPGKRFIQSINWKEVDMDDDEFQLQIYPVSKLPNDPEGRLQTIQEMMAAGLISQQVGKRLLDYPDLEAEENLSNSISDYLHTILDKIVDDKEFTSPEPYDDLQEAKRLAIEYYAQAKLNQADEEVLNMLRTFMKQIDALEQQAEQAQQQQMMAQQAMQAPPANPTPPPTSDLLNNTNLPAIA